MGAGRFTMWAAGLMGARRIIMWVVRRVPGDLQPGDIQRLTQPCAIVHAPVVLAFSSSSRATLAERAREFAARRTLRLSVKVTSRWLTCS